MGSSLENLAKMIVDYSLKVQKKEVVQIRYKSPKCNDLVKEMIKSIHEREAIALPKLQDPVLEKISRETYDINTIEKLADLITKETDLFDSYISIGYNENDYDFSRKNTTPASKLLIHKLTDYSKKLRAKKSVVLTYPSPLDAYKAKMATKDYEDYVFSIMNYDYKLLKEKMDVLKKYLEKTKYISILGEDTNITFSKENIPAISLAGEVNIPDGEVYTAPIKKSVNGFVKFNVPSKYMGNIFESIILQFKEGKVVDYSCNDQKELGQILDIDEGSKYIGEFALGLHPLILYPITDTLHDEKIYGSFHLALGQAYKNAYNGNDSIIHWDLINIQRSDYQSGQIYFDDQLIRDNGEFVVEDLKILNDEKAHCLTKRR